MSVKRLLPLLALLGLVLISALGVVYGKHQSRALFVQWQALQSERDEMNIDWGRLQLEESTWATHGRVERLSRERLGMVIPSAEAVVIVRQ